ncbi:MAG: ATP-dependent sacrificial sulfur transferase LarE [Nitrospiraceae bacterium]
MSRPADRQAAASSNAIVASDPATKHAALCDVLDRLQSVLVTFSGGIDSTLVLRVAHDRLGPHAVAVTAVSPTFPESERLACEQLAKEIGCRHLWHQTDQLAIPAFAENDAMRCYHCKTDLYSGMETLRKELGLQYVVNGVHLDDFGDDRPGIRAAHEWQVRSPLVEAGFTKADIRAVAHLLGISIADKPAAACLSSRVIRGQAITDALLRRIERAEAYLVAVGFRQVRVRAIGERARIEVGADEVPALLAFQRERDLNARLQLMGFDAVEIDQEGYRPGKANYAPADDSHEASR